MKKLFTLFISLVCLSSIFAYADELNSSQLKLRNEIKTFLQEEGYMPEIDSDGDIAFKKEGDKYYVIINSSDTSPMYVTLSKYFSYGERYNRNAIASGLERTNLIKGVKVLLFENSYVLQAEMYLVDSENFKFVFYKLMKQLNALEERVDEVCASGNGGSSYSSSGGGYSGGSSYGGGSRLVNEQFSSYSYAWTKDAGNLTFVNGKMKFEDLDDSGYSLLQYKLPRNLKNEDFQLSFSMRITFADNSYSCLQLVLGEDWLDGYQIGFGLDSGLIDLSCGDKDNGRRYFSYSTAANLNPSLTHQYKLVKKGRHITFYADGSYVFSADIELLFDIDIACFRVSDHNKIEIDNFIIDLL